jgi:hypothetical protein
MFSKEEMEEINKKNAATTDADGEGLSKERFWLIRWC